MSKTIKLFFFLSTIFFINTIIPMQQLTKREVQIKAQEEVEVLVASLENLDLEDGVFSPLSKEVVKKVFDFIHCEYPWDEIISLCRARMVCKRWLCMLRSTQAIVQQCKIPPLHFAAIKNNEVEIMYLKLHDSSLLEPDDRGFRAAHYALATKSHDALRMLKIGRALDTTKQNSEKLKPFIVKNDQESLNILCAAYDQKCTLEQLIEVVKRGNCIELEKLLSRVENPLIIIDIPADILEQLHRSKLMRLNFAMTGALEYDLFDAMDSGMNMHGNFFQLFKGFGANPNAYNEKGITLLMCACRLADLQPTLIQLLTCEDIDVNLPSKNKDVFTPLHIAVVCNNIQAARELLDIKDAEGKCRVNINAKGGQGHTSLRLAAESDNTIELFDLLLKTGADVNEKAEDGYAAIHLAAESGYVKILQALVNHKDCNIEIGDDYNNTPLGVAVIGDQDDCVRILLNNRANKFCKNKHGNTLLNIAAREGRIKSMKEILPYMLNVINGANNNGFAPLHAAIKNGHIECAQLLINAKAVIDVKTTNVGDTPLHYAASTNRVDAIELLIKHGACIGAKSNKNAKVNNVHFGGYEPLHYAAFKGNLNAVKTLIQHGANLSAQTTLGKSPLDLAYECGHEEVGKYLAEKISPDDPCAWAHYQHIRNW